MEILEELMGMASDYVWNYVWGIIETICRFILYPFFAVALYKISVSENLSNPILSIIPIYNMTYITKIIKNLHVFSKKIDGKALTVLLVICAFLRNPFIDKIPLIGDLASGIGVVFFFFYLLALHRLWEMYIPKSADSFLVLATLFPIIIPFLMFAIRNKQQVSSQMLIDYNSDGVIDEVVTIHNVGQKHEKNTLPSKSILKQELKPFWSKNSPLIIKRQEIVSLENTNIYLEITMQNLYFETIKAIFMDILCFDYLKNPLEGVSDFKLIDLSIESNQLFSTNMDIPLPDINTRKCQLIIKNIVFDNDEVWNNKNYTPLEQITAPVRIQYKPELIRLMSDKLKGRAIPYNQYLFLPISADEYWFCSCGQFNTSNDESCRNCHIGKNEIFEIVNEEKLQQNYDKMMQEKLQHDLEVREMRQQKLLEQKEKISNQFIKGKEKIESLRNKK